MVCGPRPRNAAATRGAILDAATARFVSHSYDDVGMRDIARDVGVDPALISRYFGSKEELFTAVLEGCEGRNEMLEGDRSEYGRRVARELVFGEGKPEKLRALLIILRSIGSAKAIEVVRASSVERFFDPFAQWIGGEYAAVRARLAASLIMGFAVNREVSGTHNLSEAECELMCDRLARALQEFVDG